MNRWAYILLTLLASSSGYAQAANSLNSLDSEVFSVADFSYEADRAPGYVADGVHNADVVSLSGSWYGGAAAYGISAQTNYGSNQVYAYLGGSSAATGTASSAWEDTFTTTTSSGHTASTFNATFDFTGILGASCPACTGTSGISWNLNNGTTTLATFSATYVGSSWSIGQPLGGVLSTGANNHLVFTVLGAGYNFANGLDLTSTLQANVGGNGLVGTATNAVGVGLTNLEFEAGTTVAASSGTAYNVSFAPVGVLPGVPEPETYALMLAGLFMVGWAVRRRERQAAHG